MRKLAFVAALAVAAPLTTTMTASAATICGAQPSCYVIDSSASQITNFRRIGGNLIPEIGQYSNTNPFLLDPQDPRNWPIMNNTLSLWDPANPTVLPVRLNEASVGGTINVIGGVVNQAEITQLGQLSLGTFQAFNFDTGVGTLTDMNVNGLIWTYNPATGQLRHQQAPGNGGFAVCTPAGGVGDTATGGLTGVAISGQCRQLAAAVNSSGDLGQSTINNSWLNWDGVPAGYTVFDKQTAPWHTGTGGELLIGPQTAVVWDLSDFVEGVGGLIRARVVSGALTGNNGSAVSATYELNVTFIPVPAAVWLFISGLGLLGFMRRRSGASA
jgi:hypothetical protein